jgi:nucleoside-diphosphate-sugar epimerase
MAADVLVTGGTGFIGSSLAKALVDRGDHVRILDNNLRGSTDRLDGYLSRVEYLEGDILDYQTVEDATRGMEVVYHLAYINGTENFYKFPEKVLEVGVKGALNTLDAAMRCGVRRYVVTSSSEVYNEPTRIPTPEDERLVVPDVLNPRFSYGGGKIITELLAIHYTGKTSLETVICRPHNVYGPNMGVGHVIPQLALRLKDLAELSTNDVVEFPILGTGDETRAFCYVLDATDAILLAADQGEHHGIYHVGTEEEVSIRSLAEAIAKHREVPIRIVTSEAASGGPSRRCPSIEKMQVLGYAPQWPLERGLGTTVDWYFESGLSLPASEQAIAR